MGQLDGKVAWITGGGTGIGAAGAEAMAADGAEVIVSGRREAPLRETAETIRAAGGAAIVEPLDVADAAAVQAVADRIGERFGRLDILVNSAGLNPTKRHWSDVSIAGWDQVIRVDLDGAYYCCRAVLPMMRAQRGGLVINVSSWAGRHVGYVTGPAYTAAKHAMVAMNHSLNMEECANGIRACVICPAEVATPILDSRPVPVSAEDRAKMLQPEDLGQTILFVARMPSHVCLNEILISPTWNRAYLGAADMRRPAAD